MIQPKRIAQRIAAILIAIAAIAAFGCQNPALPEFGAPSAKAPTFDDLRFGAFRGGKMIFSNDSISQLKEGMIVKIRLARVEKDAKNLDYVDVESSRRLGFLRIESIGLDGATVSGALYDEAGTVTRSFENLAVSASAGADLDADGLDDLMWAATGREGLEAARYLEFVCSRESGQVTMYELDPANYGGNPPYGIVSITPSGTFIINADANPGAGAVAKGVAEAPSFLREGDVFIGDGGTPTAMVVAGSKAIQGNTPTVQIIGADEVDPEAASPDSLPETIVDETNWREYEQDIEKASVNYEVLEIDFADRFLVSREHLIEKGSFDLFNTHKTFPLSDCGTITIGAKAGVKVDGSVKVRWLAVDYSASAGVYADAGVDLKFTKTFATSIGSEVTLFEAPTINAAIGCVPITIRLGTVKAGYSFKASLSASTTISCGFKAEAGFSAKGSVSVKNGFDNKFDQYFNRSSLVRASGSATLSETGEVYLAYEPSVTIAGILTPFAQLKVFLSETGKVTAEFKQVSTETVKAIKTPIYGPGKPITGPINEGPIVGGPKNPIDAERKVAQIPGDTGTTISPPVIVGYTTTYATSTATELVPLARADASVDAGAGVKAGVRIGIDWKINLIVKKIRIKLQKTIETSWYNFAKVNILTATLGYYAVGEKLFAKASSDYASGYVDSMRVNPATGGEKVRLLFNGKLGKDNKLTVKDASGKVLATYVDGLPCKADFSAASVTLTLTSKNGGTPVVSSVDAISGMFTVYGYSVVPSALLELF
jgi:hypothetical protein